MKIKPNYWLLVLLCFLSFDPVGAARAQSRPPSHQLALPPAPVMLMPNIDVERKKAAAPDKAGAPIRFAQPVITDISPSSHGEWTKVSGGRVWRLTFESLGATDINFGFDRFSLPPGVRLYLTSNTKAMPNFFEGPFTSHQNQPHGEFWSPPIPGGRVTLELMVPTEVTAGVGLHLTQVSLGFRDVYRIFGGPGLAKQGSCNNDVICPEGDLWRDEIRSVAAYSRGGIDACTGTLVMDAQRTFTPYFLTAFHCGITPANAASVVTFWNYESPTCGALSGGSRLQSVSGSTFRASRQDVDMALLELSSSPPPSFNAYWAGWDRTDNIPNGSVGIHHPGVDEKAISFNLDPLSYTNNCIGGGGSNTHWLVDNWEDGTTEPGSSGSAIFHPQTRGVIGFLSGGSASCTSITSDCYGRFAAAWTGGSSDAQRLQPWLDPAGNGPTVVAGSDPTAFSLQLEPATLAACRPDNASSSASVVAGGDFSDLVTLSVTGAPAALNASFSNNPIAGGGSSTLTLSNTGAVSDGSYSFNVTGSAGATTVSAALDLTLSSAVAGIPSPVSPDDNAEAISTQPTLSWSPVAGSESYRVDVATDAGFANIVASATDGGTELTLGQPLAPATVYFWRVTATNACGDSPASAVASFTTQSQICSVPGLSIPDNSAGGVSDTLVVSQTGDLTDLNVQLQLDHTYVGDLIVDLTHEGTGTTVSLLNRPVGGNCAANNIDVVFDDQGNADANDTCDADPAIGGVLRPVGALADFNGQSLAGSWRLSVSDNAGVDLGVLQRWCISPTTAGASGLIHQDGFEAN